CQDEDSIRDRNVTRVQTCALPISTNDAEIERCGKMGIPDINKVFRMDDFCPGDDAIFAATGVTDGELLKGVQFKGAKATTQTVVMRAKSGTVRFIDGNHSLRKKPNLVMEPE